MSNLIDSRTFRSICRALSDAGDDVLDIRYQAEEDGSILFVTMAQRGRPEYVVRSVRVIMDDHPVYSDVDHVVHVGGGHYCATIADARRESNERVA